MSQKPQFKRKIYFINKELQGRFIFNYFILLTLGSVLFIGIFTFFSSNTLSIVYENYHLQLGTTPGILFKKILSTQWLFIVVGGILICFITLRLTHRLAGPFFRFEKSLNEMIEGDLSNSIFLRTKDEGKSLARKINTFNEKLSNDLALINELNKKIGKTSDRIRDELKNDRATQQLIETLEKSQKEIDAKINEYKINTPA